MQWLNQLIPVVTVSLRFMQMNPLKAVPITSGRTATPVRNAVISLRKG